MKCHSNFRNPKYHQLAVGHQLPKNSSAIDGFKEIRDIRDQNLMISILLPLLGNIFHVITHHGTLFFIPFVIIIVHHNSEWIWVRLTGQFTKTKGSAFSHQGISLEIVLYTESVLLWNRQVFKAPYNHLLLYGSTVIY